MSRTTYYDTNPSEGDPFEDPLDDMDMLDPYNKFYELELEHDGSYKSIYELGESDLIDLESIIACDCCCGACIYVKGAPYQICTCCLEAQYRYQIDTSTITWYEERFKVLLDDPTFSFDDWFDSSEPLIREDSRPRPESAAGPRPAVVIIDEILDRMSLDSLTEGV